MTTPPSRVIVVNLPSMTVVRVATSCAAAFSRLFLRVKTTEGGTITT